MVSLSTRFATLRIEVSAVVNLSCGTRNVSVARNNSPSRQMCEPATYPPRDSTECVTASTAFDVSATMILTFAVRTIMRGKACWEIDCTVFGESVRNAPGAAAVAAVSVAIASSAFLQAKRAMTMNSGMSFLTISSTRTLDTRTGGGGNLRVILSREDGEGSSPLPRGKVLRSAQRA